MATNKTATASKPEPAAGAASEAYDEITYLPGDGDSAKVNWNGIEFKAHVPVRVPKSKVIVAPMPIRTPVKDDDGKVQIGEDGKPVMMNGILQPDGTLQTRHIEQRIPMVELAKTNPRFSVNGKAPPKEVKGTSRLPTDANQYRSFSMSWITNCNDLEQLEARWGHEQQLRDDCGVSQDDMAFIGPFLEMRKTQLQAA